MPWSTPESTFAEKPVCLSRGRAFLALGSAANCAKLQSSAVASHAGTCMISCQILPRNARDIFCFEDLVQFTTPLDAFVALSLATLAAKLDLGRSRVFLIPTPPACCQLSQHANYPERTQVPPDTPHSLAYIIKPRQDIRRCEAVRMLKMFWAS